MSQLLTALKQSDENNATQASPKNSSSEAVRIVHPMQAVKAQQSRVKWVVPIIIALLPAASIVAYKVYQQHVAVSAAVLNHQPELTTVESPPLTDSILQVSKTGVLEPAQIAADTDVIFMAYPELVTEPLPISDSLYVASPAYQSQADIATNGERYSDLGPSDDNKAISPIKHVAKASLASHDPYKLDNLDLSNLSPEIAAKLKSAIVATDGEQYQDSDVDRSSADRSAIDHQATVAVKSKVIPIGLLPGTVQRKLPKMNFNQHIYSSNPTKRWVKVNGHERHQGDMIAPGVKLVKIESRDVILAFDGYEISMPALSEW